MKTRGPGRPKLHQEPRTPVTMLWPVTLLAAVDAVTENRTEFTMQAIREKLAREGGVK